MYDALLVRHCAPTLTGLKTGSLFSCPFAQTQDMHACLYRWNKQLRGKGLHALPLCRHKERTLVYLYRSSALLSDFSCGQTAQLLKQFRYPLPCPELCIAHLIKQMTHASFFPHEIGLFLGYPPVDVLGFIQTPTAYKFAGCWKVYGDVPTAKIRFAAYHNCTNVCCSLLSLGVSLPQLSSPVRNIFDDMM